jgi:DNA invertase Pin-like site-specific DNA recombinase
MSRDHEASPRDAIIYVRISRDREGAGLGVERQREDCEALARRLGWRVVDVYSDNDISAYSGKPRPGYRKLLADLSAGRATAVLAWHTDRLHRSPVELEEYISICDPNGVITHTVKAGHLDLTTPSGRMVARQLGAVARFESEHKSDRQRRKRQQMAEAGQWKGGRRPFGYEADGITLREIEAEELRRVADDLLSGVSLNACARSLNERGVFTSTGNTWTSSELAPVLMRARNAGIMVHQGEEIGRAEWPPICSLTLSGARLPDLRAVGWGPACTSAACASKPKPRKPGSSARLAGGGRAFRPVRPTGAPTAGIMSRVTRTT